jgi:hypothetical protein
MNLPEILVVTTPSRERDGPLPAIRWIAARRSQLLPLGGDQVELGAQARRWFSQKREELSDFPALSQE